MTEIKVLIEGYAKEIKNGWVANSTAVLVRSNKSLKSKLWLKKYLNL